MEISTATTLPMVIVWIKNINIIDLNSCNNDDNGNNTEKIIFNTVTDKKHRQTHTHVPPHTPFTSVRISLL